MNKTVACPNCEKPAAIDNSNRFRPFCSERCRLIDLGEWVQEGYAIPDRESSLPSHIDDEKDPYSTH